MLYSATENNVQMTHWKAPIEDKHKDLLPVYQIVGLANQFNGYAFGGFVRDVVLNKDVENPKFNDLDLWFKRVDQSRLFLNEIRAFNYVLEEAPTTGLYDLGNGISHQKYFVYCKGQKICVIDVVLSAKLPVNDFQINQILYDYKDSQLILFGDQYDLNLRLAYALTGKIIIMLPTYAKIILNCDDRKLARIAKRINRCYRSKSDLWTIYTDDNVHIEFPEDLVKNLQQFRASVQKAFPNLVVNKTEAKADKIEPKTDKIEKTEPKVETKTETVETTEACAKCKSSKPVLGSLSLIYDPLFSVNSAPEALAQNDPELLNQYFGLITNGFLSQDINMLKFAFDELMPVTPFRAYKDRLSAIYDLMRSLIKGNVPVPLANDLKQMPGLSEALTGLFNPQDKWQAKLTILNLLLTRVIKLTTSKVYDESA